MTDQHACPTDSKLQSFDEGKLSDAQIDEVAKHLGECEVCISRMEQLDPNPMIKGFQLAFSNKDSDSDLDVDDDSENSKESLDRQVDSILESIRPDSSHSSVEPNGIDLFILGKRIGEDSFCEIYLAQDVMLDRYWIKFPHSHLISSVDHSSQFLADARRASSLSHDQIISVANFGAWDGTRPYYAIQWHDHATIEQYAQVQKECDFDTMVLIIAQVCMALRAAHQIRIAHRHLNPQSIYIGRDRSVYVAEFGLTYDGFYQFGLIQPISKPNAFHSPETRENDPSRMDLNSDIWSFGALLNWLVDHTNIESEATRKDILRLAKECQRKSRKNRISPMAEIQNRLIDLFGG